MKKIAPAFWGLGKAGSASVLGSGISALGGMFGGQSQTHLDDSAVRQQMQQREIAERQKEQAAQRVQQQGNVQLQAQDAASRQRVEALDRIIGTFQQGLRIK